ncbi:MAG: hypothetical protein P0Y56_00410 [Candidatus Andeanibacterium colombiense]|uniref:Uncharacterized protein n=1 Tax=Candidatus Andeanibacterium colombiense TaxID=3121345 RepID=A0AAJ5X8X0_9SPHN|nr:MAG: hypothetical protein P0Y56_00410 [Sphingomonadaceae bacterium]
MSLLLAALALALAPAGSETQAAPAPQAGTSSASYADAIRCQAFYVVYASLLDRDSDDYQDAADTFDEWYDFTAASYPDSAGYHHDTDLQAEIERIDGELGKVEDEAEAEKALSGYLDQCTAIEPSSDQPTVD